MCTGNIINNSGRGYVNFEFINADATTGQDGPYDCKINRVDLFFVPKIIKKTQAPD